jgi:L-lactate dehydrogenase complex protein LldE
MNVGLLVTCLVDLLRPDIGFATLRLLESGDCTVAVPETQTCCGQPAYNAGERTAAQALAKKTITEFEHFDYMVMPSGSCAEHVRNQYPKLLADDEEWRSRAETLAAKAYELTDFLVSVLKIAAVPGRHEGTVTYHDSCSGLRGLGIREQPRALLSRVDGLELVEMEAAGECCGFGGAFSVRYGELSAAIATRKCEYICASGAKTITAGDLGCLLNIEGRLRRMGHSDIAVRHIAELLAREE